MNAATLSSNATSNDATTKKDKIKDGIITGLFVLMAVTALIGIVLAVYYTKSTSKQAA